MPTSCSLFKLGKFAPINSVLFLPRNNMQISLQSPVCDMAELPLCRRPLSSRRSSSLVGSILRVRSASARPRPLTRLRVEAFKVGEFKWWEQHAAPNVVHVHSAKEFAAQLEYSKERLIIMDVYAKWCVACRALFPQLVKLARKDPDIVFLCVDYDENKDLCKALGIKQIPYFQLYTKEGRVASFSIGVSKLWLLKDAIAKYRPKSMPPFEPLATELQADAAPPPLPPQQPQQQPQQQVGNNIVSAQSAAVAEGEAAARAGAAQGGEAVRA